MASDCCFVGLLFLLSKLTFNCHYFCKSQTVSYLSGIDEKCLDWCDLLNATVSVVLLISLELKLVLLPTGRSG